MLCMLCKYSFLPWMQPVHTHNISFSANCAHTLGAPCAQSTCKEATEKNRQIKAKKRVDEGYRAKEKLKRKERAERLRAATTTIQ
jgi:hypothetical protein